MIGTWAPYTPETSQPVNGKISRQLMSVDDFDDVFDTALYPIRAWYDEDGNFHYVNPLYN